MRNGWLKGEWKGSKIVFDSSSHPGPVKVLLAFSLVDVLPIHGRFMDALHWKKFVRQKMALELPGEEADYAYEGLFLQWRGRGWKGLGIALLHSNLAEIRREFPRAKLYLEAPHGKIFGQKKGKTTPAGVVLSCQEMFPPAHGRWNHWFLLLSFFVLLVLILFTLVQEHSPLFQTNIPHSTTMLTTLKMQDHALNQLISSLDQRLDHQRDAEITPLYLMTIISRQTAGLWTVVEWEQKDGTIRMIGQSSQPIMVFRSLERTNLLHHLQMKEISTPLEDSEQRILSIEGKYDFSP